MAPRLQISLELELTEPVSGVLRESGGQEVAFTGWLEMNARIERLCARVRDDVPAGRRAEPPDARDEMR